jgi:hypothetical protein
MHKDNVNGFRNCLRAARQKLGQWLHTTSMKARKLGDGKKEARMHWFLDNWWSNTILRSLVEMSPVLAGGWYWCFGEAMGLLQG